MGSVECHHESLGRGNDMNTASVHCGREGAQTTPLLHCHSSSWSSCGNPAAVALTLMSPWSLNCHWKGKQTCWAAFEVAVQPILQVGTCALEGQAASVDHIVCG